MIGTRAVRLLVALSLAACAKPDRAATPVPGVSVATDTTRPRPIPPRESVLSWRDLPEAAQQAIRDSFPAFRYFDEQSYPDSVRRAYRTSADEGLDVIRASLQGRGTVDYAVLGFEGDVLKVVALFDAGNGGYRAVNAGEGGRAFIAPGGPPAAVINAAPCQFSCSPAARQFGIRVTMLDDKPAPTWVDVWAPKLRRFLVDEPID